MTIAGFAIEAGTSFPLGASWNGLGTNFALFSANATKVELCLFDDRGRREMARVPLPEYTHEIWHGYLPDIRPGQLYGYRVHGPYDPPRGQIIEHRFQPSIFDGVQRPELRRLPAAAAPVRVGCREVLHGGPVVAGHVRAVAPDDTRQRGLEPPQRP